MKVVLFCGGLGLRMRDVSETLPKPMVPLGNRPILWHLMKYYAHYGHKDFILCLGHKSHVIKDFFLHYDECVANDFVLSDGARRIELLRKDIEDWRITFVETGLDANIGERLRRVRPFLEGEEMFLANYSDGLTDAPLPAMIDRLKDMDAIASFMTARPNTSFHFVEHGPDGLVHSVSDVETQNLWVNAGFFVLRGDIFDYLGPGEELVVEPFERLIQARKLATYPYTGFWRGCDTFKDLQTLESLLPKGPAPWEVWRKAAAEAPTLPPPSLLKSRDSTVAA
jgi:glucose-1-phosphate cytidylyltransferase